jgi:hypothetical protein
VEDVEIDIGNSFSAREKPHYSGVHFSAFDIKTA